METTTSSELNTKRLYRLAFLLAIFTIVYNLIEGLIATYFGYSDESLTLLGFGIDSFIEMISGLGIAHMVSRIQFHPGDNRDAFERTALRITGYAFYTLVAGLVVTGAYNVFTGHKPETTSWGVVISLVSIAVMLVLIYAKNNVGRQLGSNAMLADARCSKVCIYMSIVLLASSCLYEWTHLSYIDTLGTLGLVYFSFREGQECFQKAKNNNISACEND